MHYMSRYVPIYIFVATPLSRLVHLSTSTAPKSKHVTISCGIMCQVRFYSLYLPHNKSHLWDTDKPGSFMPIYGACIQGFYPTRIQSPIECSKLVLLWWSRPWASCHIRKIAGCACAGNDGIVFPRRRIKRKLLVSDPGMHHGTCVTHVPWCMSGSLTRSGGENVPGIPGVCAPAIGNRTYLVRGLWNYRGNVFRFIF